MTPARDRGHRQRDRLRQHGLRPVPIWVPDVNTPDFRPEAHRQSELVAAGEHASEDQAFVDAISVD